MRLWTLHPKYLDSRGLVALWREALLAQAVLCGRTRGYLHHPQLLRFRDMPSPTASLAAYLLAVHGEATRRGYHFDAAKIGTDRDDRRIIASRGQLDYEWRHLKEKLRVRAPAQLARLQDIPRPDPHPLFRIVAGGVADWEIRPSGKSRHSGRAKIKTTPAPTSR
jgi:hypothetical protein